MTQSYVAVSLLLKKQIESSVSVAKIRLGRHPTCDTSAAAKRKKSIAGREEKRRWWEIHTQPTEVTQPGSGGKRRGTRRFRGVTEVFQIVVQQVSLWADGAPIKNHTDFNKLSSG